MSLHKSENSVFVCVCVHVILVKDKQMYAIFARRYFQMPVPEICYLFACLNSSLSVTLADAFERLLFTRHGLVFSS